MGWTVYLVRCRHGSLYAGIATDVERRFAEHCSGRGAKYLKGRQPLELVYRLEVGDRGAALRLERQLKRWPKSRKERLVAGNRDLIADLDAWIRQGK